MWWRRRELFTCRSLNTRNLLIRHHSLEPLYALKATKSLDELTYNLRGASKCIRADIRAKLQPVTHYDAHCRIRPMLVFRAVFSRQNDVQPGGTANDTNRNLHPVCPFTFGGYALQAKRS